MWQCKNCGIINNKLLKFCCNCGLTKEDDEE